MSGLDVLPGAGHDEEDAERAATSTDWAAELAPRRPVTRRVQVVLVALVVATVGFLGGILTTQMVEDDQASSALPEGVQLPEGVELAEGMEIPDGAMPDAGGGMPDPGQLAALTGAPTSYTVTVVDGSTIYLEDPGGTTVTVVTRPTTEVRHLTRGVTTDLRPGDTVTVDGDADDTGTIVAESIDQTG